MTIRDYTEEAVRKYLRTAILVDDQLFTSKSENATGQEDGSAHDLSGVSDTSASARSGSVHAMESFKQFGEALARNPLDDAPSPSTESFSPQKVVDGFYRLGIVCGLYEPKTSEFSNGAVPQRLVDLCDHSDVFILDWKLKNNKADSPVPALIWQLLSRDESCGEPRAVRFCAIYTDEALGTVFSKLHSEIKTRFPQRTAEEDVSSYRIHLKGLTIRLYRKTDATEAAGNPKRFVSSADLAETIVQDFVSEYGGIVPATALRSIAEVRDNAKRILEKFPKGMDPALVLHAGLTLKEKGIVSDITALLGDEMSSILADMELPPDELYDLCAEYVNSCEEGVFSRTNDKVFCGRATSSTIKEFLTEVFRQKTYSPCSGERNLDPVFKNCTDSKGNLCPSRGLLHVFQTFVENKTSEAKDYAFGALSALFCQRTIYSKQKILRFGTVVRECLTEGTLLPSYYLCLMPSCDSVRLEGDGPHRFPFWKLDFVSEEGETRTHGLYVKADGKYFSLCAKGKIREKLHIMDFPSQQQVVRFDDAGTLVCANGKDRLEWIAELKSAHMQRIAERVSREFSRVGLSESEWLRLQVGK